ncbi:MAG: F-box protein, partial [Chlamydiota bacterium]
GIYRLPNESFLLCISFLETTSDLGSSCRVSKVWKKLIDSPQAQVFWKEASIREGVPMVQGENRDHKDDFRFLRSITISKKVIGKYLGEVVGDVPLMSEDLFIRLKTEKDSFEPKKSQRKTHVVIIDPSALKITVSPNRPLDTDATGILVAVPFAKRTKIVPKELTVPFTLRNIKMLATYPLAGKENGPVFDSNSWPEVFNLCNIPPDRNKILIMRRKVVAKNSFFYGNTGQNAFVTKRTWKVVSIRQRGFYDAIEILKTGKCPDGRNPRTHARSAQRVRWNGRYYNAEIGGFTPGLGVGFTGSDYASPHAGVVPGIYAEVPELREL